MRLTLRTLLAYRDGVLGPGDSEDMHRRIQQSEDAGNLLKRIGSNCARLQGSSPTIVGKGLGGDPNSIAEYLDDALHGEKVPELERICLESDSYLSELASCHTLLATAMQTRVGVSDALRELAINIGSEDQRAEIREELKQRKLQRNTPGTATILRADAPHSKHAAGQLDESTDANDDQETVQVQAPMVASGGGTIKQHGLNLEGSALAHEVPEYLVGTNKGSWRIPLAIGALMALLALLIWQTLGPWDRVMGLFASSEAATHESITTEQPNNAKPPQADGEATDIANQPEPPIASHESSDSKISESSEAPPFAELDGKTEVHQNNSAVPDAVIPREETDSHAALPLAKTSATWSPRSDSDKDAVLLTQDQGVMRRLAVGDQITAAESLLVPPNFRTAIELPGGVSWTTCGPSRLTVGVTDDATTAATHVSTSLCRALVRGSSTAVGRPNPNESRSFVIASPVGQYHIQLASPDSMVSVEVAYRPSSYGSVLNENVFRPILLVIAAEGDFNFLKVGQQSHSGPIADGNQQPEVLHKLSLGEGVAVVGNAKLKKFKLQSIPHWYRASYSRPVDALAAEDLAKFLTSQRNNDKRSIDQVLHELTGHRRPETAALAVQTSLLAGRWEPLVTGFLGNDRMRSHWARTLDLATQLLAADRQDAQAAKGAFAAAGPKGPALFQLLCGAPANQLSADRLSDLVDQLGAADLESRVLASYQLQRLTGKTLGFQPHAPNRASIQQWRRELATERLKLLPRTEIIWERLK